MKTFNPLFLFWLASLILVSSVGYLGYRTLEHEVLLKRERVIALAHHEINLIQQTIMQPLRSKAQELEQSLSTYSMNNPHFDVLRQFADDGLVFVLKGDRLLFPAKIETQKEAKWISALTPLWNDLTRIDSPYFVREGEQRTKGWYIQGEGSDTQLVYWVRKEGYLIGFRVSYVSVLSEILNSLDVNVLPNQIVINEHNRRLYQSREAAGLDSQTPAYSVNVNYPLDQWQIHYYLHKNDSFGWYALGALLLCVVLAMILSMIYYLYREYTRTARLARQQVNFVGQVSHELKTPLTNISLYAELLDERLGDDDEKGKHYLAVITQESRRLSRLIQNILSFTRAPKIHRTLVSIEALMTQLHAMFLPALAGKSIVFRLQNSASIKVETDFDRVTQIISNFLSNAEKYAAQGKQIDLIATYDDDSVAISVRDYGNGIDNRELKQIFKPFYRVESKITEGVSGTGIGLTIAKQLADSLDAKISVERQQPGVSFTLHLPRVGKEPKRRQSEDLNC